MRISTSGLIRAHRCLSAAHHDFFISVSAIPLQAFGDQAGQAEAALLGQDGGELLLGIVGGAFGGGVGVVAEPPRAFAGGAQDLTHQEGFELLRGVVHLGGILGFGGGGRGGGWRTGQDGRHRESAHEITSISASRAPAARRFCRIAITSRGVEPMEASARPNSSTVAPCFNTTLRAFSSLAVTLVCGTTGVVPAGMGLGCETCISVWISTVRLPCRMATGDTRTSFPNTMVPVRSLMTTRAGRSASTVRFSSWEMNSVTRVPYSAGTATLTKPALSAWAGAFPKLNFWLTASTMRAVVVKSDCRS